MRFPRRIIAVAVLALYFTQVMGGRAIHLRWCSSGASSCCGDTLHHPHCQHGNERERDEDFPGKKNRNDSSKCRVCQVLGQAVDRPLEVCLPICCEVSVATVDAWHSLYRSPNCAGFRARAPPA